MKKKILFALIPVFMMVASTALWAQCNEMIYPEDRAKAEESYVLLKDSQTNGKFKQGIPPLNWILANVPNMHSSVYVFGATIYEGLAKAEKNKGQKQRYIDSLMIIYDLRIKTCGDEASVIQRKAIHQAVFNANTDGKEEEVLSVMDRALELNGVKVMDALLQPYMQVLRINKLKLKKLSDEEVLEKYDRLVEIIEGKIKTGKNVENLKKIKESSDVILEGLVNFDCDMVKKTMVPKYKANPSDLGLAKKIFSYMLKGKCTDDPLWLEVAEAVHVGSEEKDFGLIKVLAIKYLAKENYGKAESLLLEALAEAKEPADKAEVLIYLGGIESKNGNKSAARERYRQAIAADGSYKEAYEKIGDLYYNSFNECAKKENQADDRLVYLLAYDYYLRAGENKKMAMAKASFPSKEEIFLVNYKQGDKKTVRCWINEETTIRTRD